MCFSHLGVPSPRLYPCLSQEKWSTAEEVRRSRKEAEERMQERDRKHKNQGLTRQQAATAQMKKASEAVEQNRDQNLALGKRVAEQVSSWKVGAQETRMAYAEHGKQIKAQTKEMNATAESLKALSLKKKAQASSTRMENQEVEKKRAELKEEQRRQVLEQVAKVREETADTVIDGAKRIFYEQRLKIAADTKVERNQREIQRSTEKNVFNEAQQKRRKKSKSACEMAGKSRESLTSRRVEEAAKVREAKKALAEAHASKLKAETEKRQAQVKSVIASIAFDPNAAREWPLPVATGNPLSA